MISARWLTILGSMVRFAVAGVAVILAAPVEGQIHAGPASIQLIARVESLSVTADPSRTNHGAAEDPVQLEIPLAVTTSWAIPACLTTLRLMSSTSASRAVGISSPEVILWVQNAEVSNVPQSRTDRVRAPAVGRSAPHGTAGGRISVLILRAEAF